MKAALDTYGLEHMARPDHGTSTHGTRATRASRRNDDPYCLKHEPVQASTIGCRNATLKTILVLFPKDWDSDEFAHPRFEGRFRVVYEGFDLFRFPQNARLLTFDARRFVDRLAARYRGRIDGVISNNEHFGALIAAALARRLGLPGTSPEVVIAAQHKYYARCILQKTAPEATPRFAVFPYPVERREDVGMAYPFFVKPVKATYSVLARPIDNFAQLKAHLTFSRLEKLVLNRLIRPFNDLMPLYTPFDIDAAHMIAEEMLDGMQLNVDGYVHNGKVKVLGIVDEVMYPGTQAFMRFEYPSRLPIEVRAKVTALTEKILTGFDYDYGFFNIEYMYQPETGTIRVIEINPRMASQISNLYRRVDGCDPYEMAIALALGEVPHFTAGQGEFSTAASFIFRRFDGRGANTVPSRAQIDAIHQRYPDARLMLYFKKGNGLAREMKWLGSHRYAVLNLGGISAQDLFDRYERIRSELAFD
jgi:biotin carboxylase